MMHNDDDTIIRRAHVSDRENLVVLWERSVRATHHFLTDADVVGLRPFVADELASETYEWWVLVRNEVIIGFLGFANNTIEGLFIDPAQRSRGAGTRLVAHAQSLALEPLCVDVNEQNGAAIRFYERAGFITTRRSPTDGEGRPFPILHMRRG